MLNKKVYLGDSVYAEFDGFAVVLTTENGYGPTNKISLDDTVLAALEEFRDSIEAWVQERAAERQADV